MTPKHVFGFLTTSLVHVRPKLDEIKGHYILKKLSILVKPKFLLIFADDLIKRPYRGILVYNICLIGISNSVFDGVTNKSVLNIERS